MPLAVRGHDTCPRRLQRNTPIPPFGFPSVPAVNGGLALAKLPGRDGAEHDRLFRTFQFERVDAAAGPEPPRNASPPLLLPVFVRLRLAGGPNSADERCSIAL